eukprot:CAMPEP_0197246208 /NCGR_PEP_ID=MMETSP1429-20130617/10734_1 /TAXON_ID=49237 /ORGANISM="Chaetoceros  sp., Strain UNC1202" /LENGTH=127 /DNA_ID=CAMNT_0042706823 /DNA_START=105 /DNA_END=486 /DNA_ORIENTATION=-
MEGEGGIIGDENTLVCKFDDDDNYAMEMEDVDCSLYEQLYMLGPEGGEGGNQGPASGKLAFNFGKLKCFNSVTGVDRVTPQKYLELWYLIKKDALVLTNCQLRKSQRREKRKRKIEKGRWNGNNSLL